MVRRDVTGVFGRVIQKIVGLDYDWGRDREREEVMEAIMMG